ncbi:hypothetical protein pb186bvf_011868 [Paramecium bursaria]
MIMNYEQNNQDYFEQNKKLNNFFSLKVQQKQWNNRLINFQKTDNSNLLQTMRYFILQFIQTHIQKLVIIQLLVFIKFFIIYNNN